VQPIENKRSRSGARTAQSLRKDFREKSWRAAYVVDCVANKVLVWAASSPDIPLQALDKHFACLHTQITQTETEARKAETR
jgi:hypothetical protein